MPGHKSGGMPPKKKPKSGMMTQKKKPAKKKVNGNGLTAKQKTLPPFLQKKIKQAKKKKK